MGDAKKSLNQSMIYAIAIVLQHITSIVMLPIYTRFLTPEDYGLADLLAMGVEIIGLVVGVISGEAIFRYYHDQKGDKYRHKVVFTVFLTSLLVNVVGFVFICLSRSASSAYLFAGTDVTNGELLVLLYGATLLFQVMSSVPMAYIRAEQKPFLYVCFSALRLVLAVSCNLYFVVYQELHIVGVVYAVFTFSALHAFILFAYMLSKTGMVFSGDIAKKSIYFSWPLMISSIALFLTTYADRLFIKHYVDNTEVGLYSLAYKFGFILISFSWTPFAQGWDVRRYEVVKQDNAVEVFQMIFRMSQAVVFIAALGLAVFAQDILRIMAAEEFHEAYKITGIIIFAYIFNIWSHYCMFGILYAQKTIYKAYVDWFIFPFTFLLYFLLIPDNGALGAAWATLISLGVRFLLLNFWAKKFYDMQLQWVKVASTALVAVLLYMLTFYVQLPVIGSLLFNAAVMVAFLAFIFFGPLLTAEDRKSLLISLKSIRKKIAIL